MTNNGHEITDNGYKRITDNVNVNVLLLSDAGALFHALLACSEDPKIQRWVWQVDMIIKAPMLGNKMTNNRHER